MTIDPTEVSNAVKAYLTANPDTDGVLTLGPTAAEPTLAALEEIEMLDQVKFGTFDLSPAVLEAIDAGKMMFAIDQQQYLQGYLPIQLLKLNELYGLMPAGVVMTGPGFVDQDNAAQVIELSASRASAEPLSGGRRQRAGRPRTAQPAGEVCRGDERPHRRRTRRPHAAHAQS